MRSAALLTVAVLACAALAQLAAADNWAVIVAGSNGWYNYRHQADACHAYQILHSNGIPDDHIIVMMYDDIANNDQNPDKGVIINRPAGPNVYTGVPKDYTGGDVTPENFIHVITGNAEAVRGVGSGKVLKSGPNDNVFINFADHGGTNLIAFPSSFLYSDKLNEALKTMTSQQMYSKLTFYMEACESGSMFNNKQLATNTNIYAVTAADPDESSYACWYDSKLGTYLGDVFSVNWMDETDATKDLGTLTLENQYNVVMQETNTSHVTQYGDQSWTTDDVSEFLCNGGSCGSAGELLAGRPSPVKDAVSVYDVKLMALWRRLDNAGDDDERTSVSAMIEAEVALRKKTDAVFRAFGKSLLPDTVDIMEPVSAHEHMDTYRQLIGAYEAECGRLEEYGLKYTRVLARLANFEVDADLFREVARKVC